MITVLMEAGESTRSGQIDSGSGRFRHLIEHIQDAVVELKVVDERPIVVGVNQSFVDLFGYDRDRVVGESLNEFIVPEWLTEEATTLDLRMASGEVNYRHVRRQTADGIREFLYRGIPAETTDDAVYGFAVYTDITDLRRRERRLRVLHRVLRHNLRNEITVIQGLTATIDRQLDAPTPAVDRNVSLLEDSVDSLRGLAEEAAEIDRILRTPSSQSTVDCVPILEEVVGRYRTSHPSARIETTLPDSQTVVGTNHYRGAFDALVENAIEHNPAETPRVWIAVTPAPTDAWVDVVVADDGPIIPETERSVITGESEIDQTRHGSGLGLWLVRWTIETVGGELFFERSDAGGNRVRLRLRVPPEVTEG